VSAETGFPASAVNKAYDVLLRRNDVFPTDGGLSGARIAYTLSQMEKLKALPGSPPDAESVVDREPTDAAVQKLGDEKRP
jgi:NitT/TauT family transport system substrate-binding protein